MILTRQSRIPQRNLVITPLPHVAILSISVKMDVAHDEGIVCDLNLIDHVGYVTFICFGDVRLACLSLPLPLHTLVCLSITNLGSLVLNSVEIYQLDHDISFRTGLVEREAKK